MAQSETLFQLDTGAYRSARNARASRTIAYWTLLALGAVAVAAAIALLTSRFDLTGSETLRPAAPATPVTPAPPPAAEISVVVWNASRASGIATRAGAALQAKGYPVPTVANAPERVRGTWVLYAPGSRAAAVGVAETLALDPARTVRPLDGVRPETIAPAVVLVLMGR